MTNQPEHLITIPCELGENPLWSVEENAFCWTDIIGRCIYRYFPDSGKRERFETGVQVGCFAFRRDGGLVMGAENGLAFWDFDTRKVDYLTHFDDVVPPARFNDGKVDRQGRFWAGTMSQHPENKLYRLDKDHHVAVMEKGVSIANGLGWSPDDRIMYFTDSTARVIYKYDFEKTTGNISNQKVFATVPVELGVPDGLTVDSEGYVWSAVWNGWCVIRYAPDGSIEREITLPVQCPSSVAIGGKNLDELYITSARSDLTQEQRRAQPMSGDIFRLKVGIRGIPEPYYEG
jgi:sugar lactone lactonase YvrE